MQRLTITIDDDLVAEVDDFIVRHVHINHDNCLEVTVPKGRGSEVRAFAGHVIAERGVRHGHVVMMPIEPHGRQGHAHSHGANGQRK